MLNIKTAAFLVTKDRPMQAEACLRSMYDKLPVIDDVFILFKSSSEQYYNNYIKIIRKTEFSGLKIWQIESDFQKNFLGTLKCISKRYNYVLGLTDDTYFYRNLNITKDDIPTIFSENDWSLSFRLGLNTTIQNPDDGTPMGPCPWSTKTTLLNGQTFYNWNFKKSEQVNNWYYPISFDGCLYHSKNLYEVSNSIQFNNLREWEGNLLGYNNPLDYMVCPEQSIAVNIDSNLTQSTGRSRSPYPVSLEELNNKLTNGYRIDLDKMFNGVNVNGSHIYLPLQFKRTNE